MALPTNKEAIQSACDCLELTTMFTKDELSIKITDALSKLEQYVLKAPARLRNVELDKITS
jgi:hypothetical protein